MILTISEDKLPIKYILGIEQDLEGFPSPLDVLHHAVNLSYRNPSRYKDTFTKHACKTYWFKESDVQTIDESINILTQKGYVIETNNTPGKESYKIIINPFQ
tara:strand:- start:431 stop:736 length:306 start_codon:yes stop_codon:yes gene_type:complete